MVAIIAGRRRIVVDVTELVSLGETSIRTVDVGCVWLCIDDVVSICENDIVGGVAWRQEGEVEAIPGVLRGVVEVRRPVCLVGRIELDRSVGVLYHELTIERHLSREVCAISEIACVLRNQKVGALGNVCKFLISFRSEHSILIRNRYVRKCGLIRAELNRNVGGWHVRVIIVEGLDADIVETRT